MTRPTRLHAAAASHVEPQPGAREAAVLNGGERAVLAALRDITYGQVEIVVHSSRIVQITRSQKLRVDCHPYDDH